MIGSYIYTCIYTYLYYIILHYTVLYYIIILHYIILFYIILYYPGHSNVALFLPLWSFDTEIDNSIHFFHFVAQISDPSNFPEFDLLSLGYPSSTENRNCLLWCDTSSSENLRKKAANIRKKVQKAANSKTVTNPTDNGEGMNPLEHFFCKEQFFANERKSTARAK